MRFENDGEVWEVVRRFERCEYSLTEFDHGRHLMVGMAYLSTGSFEHAMAQLRGALMRFSGHHGKMGYHETITRFWLLQLREIRAGQLWERVNAAVLKLGNKDLIFEYYDREVLMSAAARNEWLLPQRLKPISEQTARHD